MTSLGAHEGFRATDDWFRTLFEHSPVAIVIVRVADHVILDANPRFVSLVGRAWADLVGRTGVEPELNLFADLDERDALVSRLTTAIGRVEGELTLTRGDGARRLFAGAVERVTLEGEACYHRSGADGTHQRRTQQRLAAAFHRSPLPKAITTPGRTLVEVNEALLTMLGRERDAVVGRSLLDFLTVESLLSPAESGDRLARGEAIVNQPITVHVDGGATHTGLLSSTPIVVAGEMQVLSIFTDLTDTRKVESALRVSQDRNRQITDRAALGIGRTTREGRLVSANPALARMLGAEGPDRLIGMDMHAVYADPRDRVRILEERRDNAEPLSTDLAWRRLDGRPITVHLSGWVLEDGEDGAAFEFVVEDVTERRALQEALAQAQKMEAVGQLTAGIAHDFNNLLTVVLANADTLARNHPDLPAASGDALADLREAAQSGTELVRKLLSFGRSTELRPAPHDLGRIVDRFARILGRVLPETIDVRLNAVTDAPLGAMVDRLAVEQILMNLATNARDAMPEGGRLSICVERLEDAPSPVHGLEAAGYARIVVADTGCGMDGETLGRLFEPFFTTKAEGKGTGLGLPVVYGLVQGMGGAIAVESTPGSGSAFEIILPLADLPDEPDTAAGASRCLKGSETILVVEDQADLRRTAQRILESYGYTVATAPNGAVALAVIDEGLRPDAIMSDLVMPEMGGVELLRALRARGSDTPFILTSGYAADEVTAREEHVAFLRKPWTLEEIGAALRDLLDR